MASSSPSAALGAGFGLATPEPSGPLPEPEGDGDPEGSSGWGATDFSELPEGLKAITAVRLQLPLRLAMAAYWDEAAFRAATGITACRLVDDSTYDAQVYVGWLPSGTAVFAFRGTSNRSDALMDAKFFRRQIEFLPHHFPGAKAHLGFLQQFLSVTSATNPACNIGCVLAQLSGGRTPTRVICAGHSLGGAVATLGAVWAALQYPRADVRCVTFGAPKMGNRKFVRAFQSLVGTRIRAVHAGDPVPALPPAWLARYHQPQPLLLMRGSDFVLGPKALPRGLPSLRNHQLARYWEAVAGVAAATGLPLLLEPPGAPPPPAPPQLA